MTALSVNVNKVAVMRNARGGRLPDPVAAAAVCVAAGCQGITVHPRPDARHITADDVHRLAHRLATESAGIEFNIEGNPFAAARTGYPGLLTLVEAVRPTQCTLVPDGDGQLTSDHGFRLPAQIAALSPVVSRLKALGTRVSLFVDAGCESFSEAAAIGVDRVEIYTGPFAQAVADGDAGTALADCRRTADAALVAGLGINAGHDLDQGNLGILLTAVPEISEVSIGHALFADALYAGLDATVRSYLECIAGARRLGLPARISSASAP
ncbi:MAG: pyridoxine 5'-phosphate synthase [Xanthomonadales bacterium]|nr:pyridoxine 5'-phosphate synthase [Xanthomonadales bacterium]